MSDTTVVFDLRELFRFPGSLVVSIPAFYPFINFFYFKFPELSHSMSRQSFVLNPTVNGIHYDTEVLGNFFYG